MKYLFLFLCLVLCSCTSSNNDSSELSSSSMQEGTCPNPPKLSKTELLFNALGGIDSIVMAGNYWLPSGMVGEGCKTIGAGDDPDYCNENYCKHDGNVSSNLVMKIECPWFNVKQISEYTIFVSVAKNETGEERKDNVGLQAGNCFSGFSITQSAE